MKGTKDIEFTLKIKTTSGQGQASFTNGTDTFLYTGTGAEQTFNIIGIAESTVEKNIQMTGTYNNKEYAKDTFIVFSKIEFEFNSAETQHKDTAASCTKCANQPSKESLWDKDIEKKRWVTIPSFMIIPEKE